jgi:hypothetical protein
MRKVLEVMSWTKERVMFQKWLGANKKDVATDYKVPVLDCQRRGILLPV